MVLKKSCIGPGASLYRGTGLGAALLALLPFCFPSCGAAFGADETGAGSGETGQFTALVWNVQALFDGEETGNEYFEYRSAAGWNGEKYAARLLALGEAITHARPSVEGTGKSAAPDFIGLVELENSQTLEDLARGPLGKYGYTGAFFGKLPDAPLGIGVLSRFPLTETRSHSIMVNRESAPRPILEVHLEPRGKALVFLVCHWKSKLGGEAATEASRRASARVIRRRILELKREKPGVPVIIMGDLNENHDEFYRRRGAALSALLPDDPEAAKIATTEGLAEDFLVLSGKNPPETEFFDPPVPALYTPWEKEISFGSYYYRDTWETIDHFLLPPEAFNNEGWDFDACALVHEPPFTNAAGRPEPYNPRKGLGLSDHLPLLLYLKAGQTKPSL